MKASFLPWAALLALAWSSLAQALPTNQQLIDRFKPFIKSSVDGGGGEEVYRPTQWQWLVSNSTLVQKRTNDGYESVLVARSDWDVTDSPPLQFLTTRGADLTNLAQIGALQFDGYVLELRVGADAIHGEEWPQVAQGHGVYAHVERVVTGNEPLVNIEYTIIWSNNQDRADLNQHEGDMTSLVVVYDPSSDRLVRVIYPQHGCQVEEYDLVPGQMIEPASLAGRDILTGKSENVPAVQVDIAPGNASFATEGDCTTNKHGVHGAAPDHHMFFVGDPSTLRYEHAVIFAENGTHETFPNQSGYVVDGGGHNGAGQSWLPQSVVEFNAFLADNGDNTPFVHYNGKVGTDPASIALHRTWCWPPACSENNAGLPGNIFSEIDPYQQLQNTAWPPAVDEASRADAYVINGSLAGDGSQGHPYGGLGVALSFAAGRRNGAGPSILHLPAGVYTLPGNSASICKPVVIQVQGGPAILQAKSATLINC